MAEVERRYAPFPTDNLAVGVKAATVVGKGEAIGLVSGYAAPLAEGTVFFGFAYETKDNTAGSDGAVKIGVHASGYVNLDVAGSSVASVTSVVYAHGPNTFNLTSTSGVAVGAIAEYRGIDSSTHCLVKFRAAGFNS